MKIIVIPYLKRGLPAQKEHLTPLISRRVAMPAENILRFSGQVYPLIRRNA